jgi:hypothetical protein
MGALSLAEDEGGGSVGCGRVCDSVGLANLGVSWEIVDFNAKSRRDERGAGNEGGEEAHCYDGGGG